MVKIKKKRKLKLRTRHMPTKVFEKDDKKGIFVRKSIKRKFPLKMIDIC